VKRSETVKWQSVAWRLGQLLKELGQLLKELGQLLKELGQLLKEGDMVDVVANGARFNVQHLSDGDPTVVFLHGLVVDNSSSWYYTVANPVAQRSEVVIYDLRGHGLSEKPATGYTVEEQVDDLFAILDELGIDRPVHLVGNSFGGVLAVAAAVHRPERVAGLVLVEAHVAVDGWRQQMVGTLEFAGLFLDHDDVHNWLDAVGGRKGKRLARNSDTLLHKTSLVDDLAASPAFTQEELAAIECPVLIVCGEFSDVRDWAERLVYVLPRCELHLYEGCSHLVVLEAPADLRGLLLRWFDRIRVGELPRALDGIRTPGPGEAGPGEAGPEASGPVASGPRGAESGGVEPGSGQSDSGAGVEAGSVEAGSGDNDSLAGVGVDRIIRHRPRRFKEMAPRPPWYPEDSPWPPVGGELPDGWQEAMDDFARGKGLDQAPVIPDHRDFAPPGSGSGSGPRPDVGSEMGSDRSGPPEAAKEAS
jgi:pimeloyl-ACP methyl ester carboxylesterase